MLPISCYQGRPEGEIRSLAGKNSVGDSPAAYVEKPVDPETLQKTVSTLLGL